MKELQAQFVCVRMVQANGIDLSLFQFDYNLTWAVFFLNADRTVYGRYGSRENKGAVSKISIASYKQAMEGALELHKGYPANKAALAGKTGAAPKVKTPEGLPGLQKFSPKLNPADPNKGCMHCHMVQDGFQQISRATQKALPDDQLWAHPLPNWLGLSLDKDSRATVAAVAPGSSAEKDGFKAGDAIATMAGQPVVSLADVQWVLHHAKEPSKVKVEVDRGGEKKSIDLTIAKGWRRVGDFSWRFFVHEAFYTGNLRCKEMTADEKKGIGVAEKAMALRVTRVGWPVGPPAEAKKAGFQVDDVIVGVDGMAAAMTESDFVAYCTQKKPAGSKLDVAILRGGKGQKLVLPLNR